MGRKEQCTELQRGLIKGDPNLNQPVDSDILKEGALREGQVKRSKARLEKELSKENTAPMSKAGFPLPGCPLTEPFPKYSTMC